VKHSSSQLFAARDPKAQGGAHVSLGIVRTTGRHGLGYNSWARALAAQAKRVASGSVSTRVVHLPNRISVLVTYRVKVAGRSLLVRRYAFDAGGRAYVLTFASSASAGQRYAKPFANAAASFAF